MAHRRVLDRDLRLWLAVAVLVLLHAVARIRHERFATSRRSAHRFQVLGQALVDGIAGDIVDVSVNGLAVRRRGMATRACGLVLVQLPGAEPMVMRIADATPDDGIAKLTLEPGDWTSLRALSLWWFHTPARAVEGLPDGIPAVAVAG